MTDHCIQDINGWYELGSLYVLFLVGLQLLSCPPDVLFC